MSWVATVFYAITLFLISNKTAYAYLDPGTGSILFQGLVAALATGLATAKFWWHRLVSLFRSDDSSDSEEIKDRQDEPTKKD